MPADPPPDNTPPSTGRSESITLAEGWEPVPEYVLVYQRGEDKGVVWQARGPGGVPVALKFVRLDKPAWWQRLLAELPVLIRLLAVSATAAVATYLLLKSWLSPRGG
jgi:hypothetical protein